MACLRENDKSRRKGRLAVQTEKCEGALDWNGLSGTPGGPVASTGPTKRVAVQTGERNADATSTGDIAANGVALQQEQSWQ
jgi:hypothetical protein